MTHIQRGRVTLSLWKYIFLIETNSSIYIKKELHWDGRFWTWGISRLAPFSAFYRKSCGRENSMVRELYDRLTVWIRTMSGQYICLNESSGYGRELTRFQSIINFKYETNRKTTLPDIVYILQRLRDDVNFGPPSSVLVKGGGTLAVNTSVLGIKSRYTAGKLMKPSNYILTSSFYMLYNFVSNIICQRCTYNWLQEKFVSYKKLLIIN